MRKDGPTGEETDFRTDSMMSWLHSTIRWLTLAAMTLVVAGVCIGLWMWNSGQSWLTSRVESELATFSPDVRFKLDRAQWLGDGHVQLTGLSMTSTATDSLQADIPLVTMAFDARGLAEQQQLRVTQITLREPEIVIQRQPDGTWVMPRLLKAAPPVGGVPEIIIEHGKLIIAPQGIEHLASTIRIDHVDARIQPLAIGKYGVKLTLRMQQRDGLEIAAVIDEINSTWAVELSAEHLQLDNRALNAVVGLFPDALRPLSQLDVRSHPSVTPLSSPLPVQTVSAGEMTVDELLAPAERAPGDLDLGTDLHLSVHLRAAGRGARELTALNWSTHISEGRVVHPALPFPLFAIAGRAVGDLDTVEVQELGCSSGLTRFDASGLLRLCDQGGLIDVTANDVLVDDRLRDALPDALRRLIDDLGFRGNVDVRGVLVRTETGQLKPMLKRLDIKSGISRCRLFSYPLTGLKGSVRETDPTDGLQTLFVDIEGLAGSRPARLTGRIIDPGTSHEGVLDASVEDLPLDATFRQSLPPTMQTLLEEMGLRGNADVKARLIRPRGLGNRYELSAHGHLRNGLLSWDLFPYVVEHLDGDLTYQGGVWTLSNLTGRHNGTELTGQGTVVPAAARIDPQADSLHLSIGARGATFDEGLHRAVSTCSEGLGQVWDELNPEGPFDTNIVIRRVGDAELQLEVPRLELQGASLTPRRFPYRLRDVTATVEGRNDRWSIRGLQARHGETMLSLNATVSLNPDFWTLTFHDLTVDDLLPDVELRTALPGPLKDAFEALSLRDRLSLSGSLEFKGTERPTPVLTAAWDGRVVLTDVRINPGLPLEHIHGVANVRGEMDRDGRISMAGVLDVDSLYVMGYQITQIHGPLSLVGQELFLGSRAVFVSSEARSATGDIPVEQRMRGRLFDGTLTADTYVRLAERTAYGLRLTLSQARLEEWARQTQVSLTKVAGVMNGWVDLQGVAEDQRTLAGRGQFWVSPAQLYELPVFVGVMQSLKLAAADNTAFRYAFADYRVAADRLNFDRIDLIGDALSLVGGGYIRFDKQLSLDFISTVPRNLLPIPVLNAIVNNPLTQEAGKGMVRIEVRGTVDVPRVDTKAGVPVLSDAIRALLGGGSSTGSPTVPSITPPTQFTNPQNIPPAAAVPAPTGNR